MFNIARFTPLGTDGYPKILNTLILQIIRGFFGLFLHLF